ncbi:MAG: Gfo/Idh/MocA family oxidoreductase, partial [Chthonomonadales bacterium]
MSSELYSELTRRSFLTSAAAGVATAAMPGWYSKESAATEMETSGWTQKKFGPNDQINMAVIGPGGSKGGYRQGLGDMRGIASKPGVKVLAVCDLDPQHRDEAAKIFGPDTKKIKDFREVLADKSIDAVVIGTPDHWHSTIAIAAMNAGKDVYCEKPLTLVVDEGKAIVKTWKKTKRVFQTGSQQRSDPKFRLACELVRNGRLGKINHVITHLPTAPQGGPFTTKPVPD